MKRSTSLKLSPEDDERLAAAAQRQGTSKSEIIRRAVAAYLRHDRNDPAPGSFLDRARDLVGTIEGPEDLSSNPAHLEGYGR